MNSDIGERENQPLFLDRIAAQREVYSRAKRILVWQTIASVPCAVAWSVAAILLPAVTAYAACWGVAISLLDLCVSSPTQKSKRLLAATIQELTDCDLFHLEWRQLKAGHRPGAEVVKEYASAYKARVKDQSDLPDWYPPVIDTVPLQLARLICQRTNCWWDARLRRRYALGSIAAAFSLLASMVVMGLATNLPFQSYFLCVIVPMAPVLTFGIKGFIEHKETVTQLEKLQSHVENVWRSAMDGAVEADLTKEARDIQDEIFDLRRNNPMVFDWIHNRLRAGNETLMRASADELVQEASDAAMKKAVNV